MIRIRVKAVDKLLPAYLYHTLKQIETQGGFPIISNNESHVSVDEMKELNCRCTDTDDVCKLTELCDIIELDDNNSNVVLERGDISIDDNNQVKIFE